MIGDRVLVVWYSRTGTTTQVAEAIATAGDFDREALVDERGRDGWLGYLSAAIDGLLGRPTRLARLAHDPGAYDLVVIGSPVWNASLSSAVRTFLAEHAPRLREVAFFVTEGGRGDRRVFGQMAELAGKPPVDELAITERQVSRGEHLALARRFAGALRDTLVRRRPRPEAPAPTTQPPPV